LANQQAYTEINRPTSYKSAYRFRPCETELTWYLLLEPEITTAGPPSRRGTALPVAIPLTNMREALPTDEQIAAAIATTKCCKLSA